jgi:hypothetical protein
MIDALCVSQPRPNTGGYGSLERWTGLTGEPGQINCFFDEGDVSFLNFNR